MNEMQTKVVRRQFDRGFKVDAVRLVSEGGQRLSDVARQVGITPKMLSQWRRQMEQHATPKQAFVGAGNDREAEVKPLKRKPLKRKPLKRKPLKRKPLKRKPLKRKPLKRKPLKRKPLKRKPLKRRIALLEMERDILKKAIAQRSA